MEQHRRTGLVLGGIGVLLLGILVVWPLVTEGYIPFFETTESRYTDGEIPILFSILVGAGSTVLGVLSWFDIYCPAE